MTHRGSAGPEPGRVEPNKTSILSCHRIQRAKQAVSNGHGHLSDVPTHFNMALIWTDEEKSNGAIKGTYLEGVSDFILIFILF